MKYRYVLLSRYGEKRLAILRVFAKAAVCSMAASVGVDVRTEGLRAGFLVD